MPFLFSYGTLQQGDVQLSLFGHLLNGELDELIGFEQSFIEIDEPSGKAIHAIVKYTGRSDSRVHGTLLELSDEELNRADVYEPPEYVRVSATLASGKQAWLYADARSSAAQDSSTA
jgi:gamma-glutamylcyclotransferase (GGCT)/AIG2-like uncharacterized protein YtfP